MNNTILVIEDNLLILKNIHTILELSNYNVLTAENGMRGVEKAKQEKPDLILCDIMMPELDGYSVLHMLGKDPKTKGIPFIFLTSKTKQSDFRKGMNHGADDYLTKPFEDMDLLNTIEKRLDKSKKNKSAEFEQALLVNDSNGLVALKKLSENKKVRKLKKGDTLFASGDFPSGVYYVNKGKIKTSVMNAHGKEFITGFYKEGDFIGHLSILAKKEYECTAAVFEDSEVLKIPKEDFLKLYGANKDLAYQFLKILSENIFSKEQQLLSMAYDSVRKRIALALVELYHKYKKENEKYFTISIKRDDLASKVGTSKETVIRTFSEFKENGLLKINRSEITILDIEGLKKIQW